MKISVYNQEGKSTTDLTLNSAVFQVEAKPALITQAIKTQKANMRQSIAHTKTRGEVSGGGRKPWKQKGTGNARAGSSRSPLWIGGGITFGPRNVRNFDLRMPQKMRSLALKALLSEKVANKKLIVLEDLKLKNISTKSLVQLLQKLPIEAGKILVILSKPEMNFELSAANLAYLKVIKAENLNALDILSFDYLLTDTEAMKKIETIFGQGK